MDIKYKRIPIDQMTTGMVYEVSARSFLWDIGGTNKTYALWNGKEFLGVRSKFGQTYVSGEEHYDTGPPFGTCSPLAEFKNLPADIEIPEDEFSASEELYRYLLQLNQPKR